MPGVCFADVVERRFKWPPAGYVAQGRRTTRSLDTGTAANLDVGLEGLMKASLTRGLGGRGMKCWCSVSSVRSELRNPRIHSYLPL